MSKKASGYERYVRFPQAAGGFAHIRVDDISSYASHAKDSSITVVCVGQPGEGLHVFDASLPVEEVDLLVRRAFDGDVVVDYRSDAPLPTRLLTIKQVAEKYAAAYVDDFRNYVRVGETLYAGVYAYCADGPSYPRKAHQVVPDLCGADLLPWEGLDYLVVVLSLSDILPDIKSPDTIKFRVSGRDALHRRAGLEVDLVHPHSIPIYETHMNNKFMAERERVKAL